MVLPNPECDMDLTDIKKELKYVNSLVALKDGGALISNYTDRHHVVRVDREGRTVPPLYTCTQGSDIMGISTYHVLVFLFQSDGFITKYNINDITNTVVTYKVDVDKLCSGTLIEYNQLLLPDFDKDEVFVYNTDEHSKQVVITDVRSPVSVSCNQNQTVIAVCELDGHCVSLYNKSYVKQTTIGSYGRAAGCLDHPSSVIITPSGSFLVADFKNNRVSEFGQQGAFLRHVITQHIECPYSISFSHPYLWVACQGGTTVKRFRIYQ